MITLTIPYPMIDPVLISIGPFAIRWYALAYISGIVLGWRYVIHLIQSEPKAMTAKDMDDFIVWITFSIVLGGRLGYVLFYKPLYYLDHPLESFQMWHGGMSFHGGLLGVISAVALFCRQRKLRFFAVADLMCCASPIGLFFGRLANFINSELWGRITDVPWAMVFPNGGPLPRHPSQLYEAGMEGILLGLVLYLLWRVEAIRMRPGVLTGAFFIGYGLSRIIVEFFRQPDAHLGYLMGFTTMGQVLSLPMLALGTWFILRARRIEG